ncbi:NYN domain-containing protein [Candidatus Harpocratesius sp.]
MTEMIGIEIDTKGKSTIPKISPENIITIHGKNGVGKSMASTLMEIAAGEYTFKNEEQFLKLSQIIQECKIQFHVSKSLIFKVHLQPYLWKYDRKYNRANPLTLGKFYKNNEEISFQDLKKMIYLRTIRGNESLQQQILFFQDIFKSKIDEKLQKLEKKLEFLKNFEIWFKNNTNQPDLEEYLKLQQEFNEHLDSHDNLKTIIKTRESKIKFQEEQLNLLEKLEFLLKNNPERIEKTLNVKIQQSKSIQEKINKDYSEQNAIKSKIQEFEKKLDKNEKNILTKIQKLQNKQNKIIEILALKYNITIDQINIIKNQTSKNIRDLQIEINTTKKKIEKLNSENSRILQMKSYITKMRDICSQASTTEMKDEKIFSFSNANQPDNSIQFSFYDLYCIVNSANLTFKEEPALKKYQEQIVSLNNDIRTKKDILEKLTEYSKISNEIKSVKLKQKGVHKNIDDYLDLEEQFNRLQFKEKEVHTRIKELESQQQELIGEIQKLKEIKQKLEKFPTEISIKSELKKKEIKSEIDSLDICEKIIQNTRMSKKKESDKFIIHKKKMEDEKQKIQEIKEKISLLNNKVQTTSEKFGYKKKGEFLNFINSFKSKFSKYQKNTEELYKRLKSLQDDISRIIKGSKPKNSKNLSLITSQFDEIFRNIYGKKEFFDYVFKEYRKIKRFDIAEKTIIFETHEGFEERRDLDDFSSGEKTYAYCRAIISIASNVARYNIVILDESYALLDHEHSMNLYEFQRKKIDDGSIIKFINILPLKEDLSSIYSTLQATIDLEKKNGPSEKLTILENNFEIIRDFYNQVDLSGYYQEINYPYEKTLDLALNKTNLIPQKIINYSPPSSSRTSSHTSSHISSSSSSHTLSFASSFTQSQNSSQNMDYSFILDGSNISRNNSNSKYARISDVLKCKQELIKKGIPEDRIFILFGAGIRHHIAEIEVGTYNSLLKHSNVNQAPKGKDDDWFILSFAKANNGYIISNDYYKEYREKYPEYREFLKNHSIRYNILHNQVFFEEGFDGKLQKILNNNAKAGI